MIGYILLILAIILYFQKEYRFLSILIFLSFISGWRGGFGLLTNEVIGAENMRLGFFYMVVVLALRFTYKMNTKSYISKRIFLYAAYLVVSIGISLLYYVIPYRSIYNSILTSTLIFAVFLFIDLEEDDFLKIFRFLYFLTLITSILFIIQAITGINCLPYTINDISQSLFGLYRYYNMPPFLFFFTVFSFIYKRKVFSFLNIHLAQMIFLLADLLTFGRVYIFLTIACILLTFLLNSKRRKIQALLIS